MNKKTAGLGSRPLSFARYTRNNLKRTLSMMTALTPSVFMIIIFETVIYAANEPARLVDVAVAGHLTKAYPGKDENIDVKVIKQIDTNPDIEKAIPMF